MSEPKQAQAVKLFASILFSEKAILPAVLAALTEEYGLTDFISPARPFLYTDYYCREMGLNMERLFVSFAALIRPESLPGVKLRTNELEKEFSPKLLIRSRKSSIICMNKYMDMGTLMPPSNS